MMVGYADIHGDIGLQTMGYIPKRHQQIGSLVLNLTEPQHQWLGYVPLMNYLANIILNEAILFMPINIVSHCLREKWLYLIAGIP